MESKDFKSFILEYLMLFLIGAVVVVYLLTALLTINSTGKNVWQIIESGWLFLILSIVVVNMFDIQGLLRGSKTTEFKKARDEKDKTKKDIEPIIQHLDEFCHKKNIEDLRQLRTEILGEEGLKYYDYFNEQGEVIDNVKFDFEQRWFKRLFKKKTENQRKELVKYRTFRKALTIDITKLTPRRLMSDGRAKKRKKYDIDKSKDGYLAQSNLSGLVSKFFTMFVFGCYMIDKLTVFSWANLIWTVLQVIIVVAFGLLKMYKSFSFMQVDYVDKLNTQRDLLREFQNRYNNKAPAPMVDYERIRTEVFAEVMKQIETEQA